MIDLKALREDPEAFRASQRNRGEDPGAVDTLLAADETRRAALSRFETLRAEQNQVSKSIGKAAPADWEQVMARAKELAAQVKEAEAAASEAEAALRTASLAVSNLLDPAAPVGGEEDFTVLETHGTMPQFDFPVRDHLDIGELLGAIDTERGAKISGARFYLLTGVGAMLEFALINLAMEQATAAGFTPVVVPALVKPESMEGTGFLGAHADEVYRLATDDLYLVGTSEVALAGMHAGEILPGESLPRHYAGFSACFRREAGSYGKDTRGIIRVHWFDKVEMFTYCDPADAVAEHRRILDWEIEFLSKLELPFRVIDVASGDLGSSAARKFDCEAWLPSQQRYLELTSTSNCTTFQSRRLGIRYRAKDSGPAPVATLNGTLCAIPRAIVAIFENHQQADGSVKVPKALQPYLGGKELLAPLS